MSSLIAISICLSVIVALLCIVGWQWFKLAELHYKYDKLTKILAKEQEINMQSMQHLQLLKSAAESIRNTLLNELYNGEKK